MDKVQQAFAAVYVWCEAHPKASAVIAALLVGFAVGLAL